MSKAIYYPAPNREDRAPEWYRVMVGDSVHLDFLPTAEVATWLAQGLNVGLGDKDQKSRAEQL